MLQCVNGITAPVGTMESQPVSQGQDGQGSSFSSLLGAALDGGQTQATSSSAGFASASLDAAAAFNPLPARSLPGNSEFWPQKAPEHDDNFLPLDWPGAYLPPQSASGNLPSAESTYTGGTFDQQVSLSLPQQVGSNIFQFHFPHILEKDGTYYAYFIDHKGTQNEVGLATSSDGVNWSYQGKVLERGADYDAAQASFPDVQYDDSTKTWYMLYEGKSKTGDVNSVCLATSSDGYNWNKQGPVISPGQAGDMSAVDVGTPTMFKENGKWNVYFHGLAKDGRVRIGYASGTDLAHLSVKNGPILDVDAAGAETGTVGDRSNVVKVGDYYYMAYETSTAAKDFSQAQWGISLARSTRPDGGWEKIQGGSILENPRQGFGTDGPELSVQDGRLYLYYRQAGNTTARREVFGLA